LNVLFVGGFLGSGKTTVINRLLNGMAGHGLRAAVVENEIGEIGVDQEVLGGSAVVTALSGGCVCCELFGDLLTAIGDVRAKADPDWLVIETTGLAMMESIKSNYEAYGSREIPFYIAVVADCARFELLWTVVEPLLRGQLSAADVVLLTKTDVAAPTQALTELIAASAPGADLLDASVDACRDLWACVEVRLEGRESHAGSR